MGDRSDNRDAGAHAARACAGGLIFAEPWWLDAVAPGRWEEVTATPASGGSGRFPFVRSTLFGRFTSVGAPPLTPRLGPQLVIESPVGSAKHYSDKKAVLTELIASLPRHDHFAQNCSAAFDYWLPFHWAGYEQTTFYSYVLDDIADPDALWQGLAKSHRRRVKKGRADLTIRDDLGPEVLLVLLEATFDRQGLRSGVDLSTLARAHEAASARGAGRILVAVDERQRPIAGGFFVSDATTTYYLLGGRADGAPDGMPLVLWEAIGRAAELGTRFDFEGSMIEGIEEFFRRFGARPEPYSSLTKVGPAVAAALAARRSIASRGVQLRSKLPFLRGGDR